MTKTTEQLAVECGFKVFDGKIVAADDGISGKVTKSLEAFHRAVIRYYFENAEPVGEVTDAAETYDGYSAIIDTGALLLKPGTKLFTAPMPAQAPVDYLEELPAVIAELKDGSNWLSGKHNLYSYSRAPKIAATILSALDGTSLFELVKELQGAHKWKREGFGHWKDASSTDNDAPFQAAKILSQMLAVAPAPPNHIPDATKMIRDIAWQLIPSADHCGLIRFMSQRQYDLQPDNIKKWYQPYRCPACIDNDALKAKLIECRPSVKADLIRWEQFLLRKAGACNQCDHDETQRVHELLTAIDALKGGE